MLKKKLSKSELTKERRDELAKQMLEELGQNLSLSKKAARVVIQRAYDILTQQIKNKQ